MLIYGLDNVYITICIYVYMCISMDVTIQIGLSWLDHIARHLEMINQSGISG